MCVEDPPGKNKARQTKKMVMELSCDNNTSNAADATSQLPSEIPHTPRIVPGCVPNVANSKSVNDVDMEKEKEQEHQLLPASANEVKQWKDQIAEEIEMLNKMAQHLGAEVALTKAASIYQKVIASMRPNLIIGNRKLLIAACLWWAVRIEILPINIKMITKSFELNHRDLQKQYLVLNPGRLINYSKRAKEDKINLVEKFINRFIQRMNPPLPLHKFDLIHHCIRHLMTPSVPVKVQVQQLLPPTTSVATIPTSTSALVNVGEFKLAPKPTPPLSSSTTISIASTSTSTAYSMPQSTSQRPWTIAAAILFKACEMCQCRRSYEEIAALACIDSSTVRSAVKPL